MKFQGQTVIVTGAAMGVGRATSIAFAQKGACVCMLDVNEEKLTAVCEEIAQAGGNALSYVCDIGNEARVREVVKDIEDRHGHIDVLVNNAGLWRFFAPFTETTSDNWELLIRVNILGTMYLSQAVLGGMIARKYGRIINIGSVAGTYGNANMVPYSMTKGAVSSFTKALAKEVAADGITVNNVTIGNVWGEADQPALSFMNRSGKPEEFASFICYLASKEASYISGQDHQIDGCRRKM